MIYGIQTLDTTYECYLYVIRVYCLLCSVFSVHHMLTQYQTKTTMTTYIFFFTRAHRFFRILDGIFPLFVIHCNERINDMETSFNLVQGIYRKNVFKSWSLSVVWYLLYTCNSINIILMKLMKLNQFNSRWDRVAKSATCNEMFLLCIMWLSVDISERNQVKPS